MSKNNETAANNAAPIAEQAQIQEVSTVDVAEQAQIQEVSTVDVTIPDHVDFLPANVSEGKSLEAIMAASKNLNKASRILTLTNVYKEFSLGEIFRGVYFGQVMIPVKDPITKDLVERKAVRLINDGVVYLNAGVNLVNQFERNSIPVGTAVEIEFIEKQGNVKVYSVALLG
jgi:hypothetical protein